MNLPRAALTRFGKPALWMAAVALLGAAAFWVGYQNRAITVEQFIPLVVGPPPSGLVVSSPMPNGVEIHLRGPRHAVETLVKSNPACRIDLVDAGEGTVPILLTGNHITLPPGITLAGIEPAVITLKLDRLIHKQVPVTVIFSGKPAAGYSVGEVGSTPTTILLSGPAQRLDSLEQIPTAAVDITGAKGTIQNPLTLDLPEGVTVAGPDKTVTGGIHIVETIASRKFTGMAVSGKNSPYQTRVSPAAIDIEVEGPINILDGLKPDKGIDIHVDLADLKPGVYVRRAVIGLPVKTTLISARPELFTVTLTTGKENTAGKKADQ
ncbi:MAG: hypothetical protein JEZ11_02455 [Desulfobacterales bacterium]|nr:hypothetical protein [Desulfobacterales bacterium]